MRTRAGPWLAPILAALGGAAMLAAQTPQRPPVFRSGVDVVPLDVSVLDKARRPVHGLTADDFVVREDGKAQPIAAVSEVRLPEELAVAPVWSRAAPPDVASTDVDGKRLLVIAIDAAAAGGGPRGRGDRGGDSRAFTPAPIENVQRIAHGILARVGPEDLVAIVGHGVVQPFTNDLDKLRSAVDRLNPLDAALAGGRPGQRALIPSGPALIRGLADYLTAVPDRRKAILFISAGFAEGGRQSVRDVDDALWFAQWANVNIYSINPIPNRNAGSIPRRLDGPMDLAERTGGTSIADPRTLDEGLDRLFLENGSYYIVGYRTSSTSADGRVRRIAVAVRGRDDLVVRARTQIARAPLTRPAAPRAANGPSAGPRAGGLGLLPNLDVTFDVAPAPFAQAGRIEAAVPVAIALSEPAPAGVTRVTRRMNVRVLIYDERGTVRAQTTIPVPVDASSGLERRLRYETLARFDLAPGRYSVRVVAHTPATDALGTIEFDLLVPDFARDTVSISGVVLGEQSALTPAGAERTIAFLPIVPTARRTFQPADRLAAYARIYQGGQGPIVETTLEVRVLDAAGGVVLETRETLAPDRFEADRGRGYRLSLPLDRLQPGHYLLSLQASIGARHSPKRDVRFTVRN